MPDRTLRWGVDGDYVYQSGDADAAGGGNFVVVEDTDAGTVLLEWDATAGEWVSRGPVELDGNDVTNVGALDAVSASAGEATINDVGIEPSRGATRPDAHVARTEVSNLPGSHMHAGERMTGFVLHPLYQEESVSSTGWSNFSDNPEERRMAPHFSCPANMVPVFWVNATVTNDTSGERTSFRLRSPRGSGEFVDLVTVTTDGTDLFQNCYQETYLNEVPQASSMVNSFNGPSMILEKKATGGSGTIHPRTAVGVDYEVI